MEFALKNKKQIDWVNLMELGYFKATHVYSQWWKYAWVGCAALVVNDWISDVTGVQVAFVQIITESGKLGKDAQACQFVA